MTSIFLRSILAFGLSFLLPGSDWSDTLLAADVFTQVPTIEPSQTRAASAGFLQRSKEALRVDIDEGPRPEWIWGSLEQREETFWYRARFEGGCRSAKFIGTCDNQWDVSINGHAIVKEATLETPIMRRIEGIVRDGENEILVRGSNFGGPAGLLVKIFFEMPDGKRRYLVTDGKWEVSRDPESDEWRSVHVVQMPDFRLLRDYFFHFLNPDSELIPSIPRDVFNLLPGFQVERLYDAPSETQGSWVCLVLDQKGRLLASPQHHKGLYRIEPSPPGSKEPTRVEKLDVDISGAQGMVAAFGSLYVIGTDPPENSLFRLRDTTGDDQYDEIVKLRFINGAGEHGPHALRLSPDGKWIYLIAGNATKLPEMNSSRVPLSWKEDQLLPNHPDPFGFCQDVPPPGGFVCRFNEDATDWELISIGLRNPYDMDFGPEGELFTYDADMEDDMGTAWYRPTRVCHVVSGSDFGWRNGSGKWPPYYADTLPPVVETGPGSPVGVTFGTGASFPEKYQRALFVLDWSFGTIHAVHLEPTGSTWTGKTEEFISRAPLPLTDAVVGKDGALYFTTGGRNLPSALFRVTWVGDPAAPLPGIDSANHFADMRRRLEDNSHNPVEAKDNALEFVKRLENRDRFFRHALRIALEHQEVDLWRDAALRVSGPYATLSVVVALARHGDASLRGKLIAKLRTLDFETLSESLKLELLRAYALVCARMGRPDHTERQTIIDHVDAYYPADVDALNRELSRLLVYLDAPTVIGRTLALMKASAGEPSREISELLARNLDRGGVIARMIASGQEPQNTHYARILSNVRYGWTLEQRKEYFEWIRAALSRRGGRSYEGYVENIRKRARENASEGERTALAANSPPPVPREADLPKPEGPGCEWTLDDIVQRTATGLTGRDFEKGKRAYAAAQCVLCHRFDGEGGATGPDLTDLGGRFSLRDIAEAIISPSKAIPDRYQASVIVTAGGDAFTGRVIGESDEHVSLLTDPVDLTRRAKIKKVDIVQRSLSLTSLMPEKLLNPLNEDELLDLLAYLISRGNPRASVFSE